MIVVAFIGGVLVGMIATFWILARMSAKFNKRRKELYAKAGSLWTKAGEMFETAKIWNAIGDKKSATDALAAAQNLAKEAENLEDEADGRPKAP